MLRFTGDIMRLTMKFVLRLLVLAFLCCFAATLFLTETIRPKDATRTALIGIAVRLRDYFEKNGVIVDSLDDLPKRKNYHDSICDGWSRRILYFNTGSVVRLLSYGKDGVQGGIGDDADLECLFNLDTNTLIRVFEVQYNTVERTKEASITPAAPAQAGQPPSQTAQ